LRCPYCKAEVSPSDFAAHHRKCPNRPLQPPLEAFEKEEIKPGDFVKLDWHLWPHLVVEEIPDGYVVYCPWELKWREISKREIERKVKPDPNAPYGSPEEMASRIIDVKALLEELQKRRRERW